MSKVVFGMNDYGYIKRNFDALTEEIELLSGKVGVKPPTFVIFVNNKELMHFSYTRYIENKIREAFGFSGTSLKFIIRERSEKDGAI